MQLLKHQADWLFQDGVPSATSIIRVAMYYVFSTFYEDLEVVHGTWRLEQMLEALKDNADV